ncbi:dephospho-CoA kinase [Microlunatus sp. Gsoil 973]|uniref:dephospho-CoA kinase n=1 Tax=Microlunatus sp. Gsoil 973 TaxID=2672569 RepID=UPI0012B4D2F7|nr:dephospho-CoA kinase [Microlunatus sp. Gsoil 973]QGN31945.1 dephospho-CoA kinase [Microlunatus sp. Gsoil 973]
MARFRIGLTGGIASGKTTVGQILADCGAVIIDSDLLAREAVEPGTDGLAQIVRRFGDRVISDGRLDRAELGRIIFADARARRDLEAIIHPAVRRRAAELETAAGPDAVVVQMIPLLVETGQQDRFDAVIVVDVPEHLQRERLMARNRLSAEEADARIAAQATRDQRNAAATVVIDNSSPDREDLRQRVEAVYRELIGETPHQLGSCCCD